MTDRTVNTTEANPPTADTPTADTPTAEDISQPTIQRTPIRVAGGLVRAARPRQWVKGVLVFAAPFAAGKIGDPGVLRGTLIAFAAFSLAASAIYLINDAKDAPADRAHPTKRNRPIAAGLVPIPLALAVGAVLLLAGLGVALTRNWHLLVVIAIYGAVQLGYCFGLKDEPVIDLCIVASGFLLRSIAGGVASNITLSQWFLLATAFGSLFMVSGKRYAEIQLYERTGAQIRASLRRYSASYLRFVWATSVAIVIAMYGLWAFDLRSQSRSVWAEISIVPFVIALLRYAMDVDSGRAGEPEDIVLRDRVLQILGVAWVLSLALAFYL